MKSDLKTVGIYLKTVPGERKTSLLQIRKLCKTHPKGFEEAMEYGIPSYKRGGTVEVAFNSQKNYISLYILNKDVLDKYRYLPSDLSVGEGCIRYSSSKQIKFDMVERLLIGTYHSRRDYLSTVVSDH